MALATTATADDLARTRGLRGRSPRRPPADQVDRSAPDKAYFRDTACGFLAWALAAVAIAALMTSVIGLILRGGVRAFSLTDATMRSLPLLFLGFPIPIIILIALFVH